MTVIVPAPLGYPCSKHSGTLAFQKIISDLGYATYLCKDCYLEFQQEQGIDKNGTCQFCNHYRELNPCSDPKESLNGKTYYLCSSCKVALKFIWR